MQLIISPSKKMQINQDDFEVFDQPYYQDQSNYLRDVLRKMDFAELKKLWQASDKLVSAGIEDLKRLDYAQGLTPAIMAYTGLQYQAIGADLLTQAQLDYLQDHLWILSAFYGALRPFDGVQPHRLDMKDSLNGEKMYDFWGERLADLVAENGPVINLASDEYAKSVQPYLEAKNFITIAFKEKNSNGKYVTKATNAKRARGYFVRWCAEEGISDVTQLRNFDLVGWTYNSELSQDNLLTFIK